MEHARCASTYRSGDMQTAIDRVKNNAWLKNEMEVVAALLQARTPRTLDELGEYIGACNVFFHALAFQQMADDLLANLPQSDDDDVVYPPTAEAAQDQIIAWLNLQVVRDCLDFMSLKRGQPIPEGLALGPVSDFYRRAAEANHAVFEALVVQPTANRVGAAPDRVRAMLNEKDYTFALSQALFKVRGRLPEYFDAEPARSYAQLTMALSLYLQESDLIAKYYSLSADLDENMQITGVKSEGALNNWLQFSEEQTRRNMGELVRVGIDPTTCMQLYEVGHMARMRDLDGKLDAIDYLWQANLLANVMRQIAALPPAVKSP
jgi:hypothetical protein